MEIHASLDEIIDTLKKLNDADPADSHHAPEWKECQKSRIKGVSGRTSGRVISRPRWTARRVMSPRRRRRATRHCQSGRRVELLIFDQNEAVVCLRKRQMMSLRMSSNFVFPRPVPGSRTVKDRKTSLFYVILSSYKCVQVSHDFHPSGTDGDRRRAVARL